jgi:HAD superfamily hydrolase (TIGR01484 family)
MKKKYKAIISDIDETITVAHPEALPSENVRSAIRKAVNKGIIFSIASARPYSMLSHLIEDLGIKGPIIINNGAELYDTKINKSIWESLINFTTASEIFKTIKTYQKVHVDLSREVLINPESLPYGKKVSKFIIFDLKPKEADILISYIQKKFKNVNCSKGGSPSANDLVVYISNGSATKQHAVLKFAEYLSIEPSEIIGIGDHYNDFPLLMACGLKVAMGNAVPELKAIADYIAPTVTEDGVVDVIEKFIL